MSLLFRRSLTLALVVPLFACTGTEDRPSRPGDATPVQPTQRRFVQITDTLWRRGGPGEDSLLAEPVMLGTGDRRVYLSEATRGVIAFADDGRTLWRAADNPSPRLSIARAGAIVFDGPNSILVGDRTGKIVRLDSSGVARDVAYVDDVRNFSGLCRLARGILLDTDDAGMYRELTTGGAVLDHPAYPFPALADSSQLLRPLVLASAPESDGCVIAQAVGNEFALREPDGTIRRVPYVEQIALPVVQLTIDSFPNGSRREERLLSPIHTAETVATTTQLIAISFGGAAPRREGIIDLYARTDGRYLGTVRMGTPVSAVALAGDTLYVAHLVSGVPALTALRLPPLS